MVVVAAAIVFLALVILFREEIRHLLGIGILLLLGLWVWEAVLAPQWVAWVVTGAVLTGAAVYAQKQQRLRREQLARAVQAGEDLRLADLRYRWEHGELTDDQYQQAIKSTITSPG